MPGANSTRNEASKKKPFLLSLGLLIGILVVLFHKSFEPGMVAFSNDNPLGQMATRQGMVPQTMFGEWDDLNSVGFYGGTTTPNITGILKLLWEWPLKVPVGSVGFSNSYAPVALFILGLGALVFFNQLRFSPLAALLGVLATMLNSTFFGVACWGIAPLEIAMGINFLALALVMANTAETPRLIYWIRFALAGLCVGMNVMESPDVGGLASMMVALFVFFKAFADEEGTMLQKTLRSTGRVIVVTVFAGFLAAQTVLFIVDTQIKGVAGTAQDAATKAAQWDFATQWSLPKKETLGLFVPGLFGFKMDTPNEMPASLQSAYQGGVYWGGMGRDPANDRFLDSGGQGPLPDPQWMRQTGNGNYCGILVGLVGAWTIAQSFRRNQSPFTSVQKRYIWFWSAILLVSLLLAWGRFAPFYEIIYHLPYFSTIRNPTKFLIFFTWALVILFAYGINALSQTVFDPKGSAGNPLAWWKKAGAFDRGWTFACAGMLGASVVGWLIYSSQKPELVKYLQNVGFADEDLAGQIATFSIGAVGWFIILFTLAVGLLGLVLAGCFNGTRAKAGGVLLAALLMFDLIRADLPYIIHWDYYKKYEVGSLNSIESTLRDKAYEHRVAVLPFDAQTQLRGYDNSFGGLGIYRIEWAQHHFPYYNIQSLDIIQMPRMPEDLKEYLDALSPHSMDDLPLYGRLWELTNTRYLLGAAGFLNVLNEKLDPGRESFRIAQRFDIAAKKDNPQPTGLEDLTAVASPDGDLALFDFTGALPRAKLYGNWQVQTNDQTVLKTLADLKFDPAQTVLISTPQKDWPAVATNSNNGTVEFESYAPKEIVFSANAPTPSVLLMNDHYNPHWEVTVDGKPAELLRCNFIMRGVYLTAGTHTVQFRFSTPNGPLYLTLAALSVGMVLAAVLVAYQRRKAVSNQDKS